MPVKSVFLKVISPRDTDGDNEQRNETPDLPGDSVGKEADIRSDPFVFRPLTEEEKNEFMNSLSAKGKKTLAEHMGEEKPSKTTAA